MATSSQFLEQLKPWLEALLPPGMLLYGRYQGEDYQIRFDQLPAGSFAGYRSITRLELLALLRAGKATPGMLYWVTSRLGGKLDVVVPAVSTGLLSPYAALFTAEGKVQAVQYEISADTTSDFTGGGGSRVFTADIPVLLSNGKTLGKYFSGQTIPAKNKTFEAVMRDIAIEEQFPGYTQPQPSLASSMQGYVERGTTIKPVLTPGFNPGDAGALTSYQLRRNSTQLAADNAPPITFPAFSDEYKIGEEVVTYFATFGYAQGAVKLSDQGNPAPGRIEAGSKQAQASITGAPKIFYGPTASPSDSSAKARALPFSRLTVDGGVFILNTGTTGLIFEIVAPENLTVSVIDLDALSAPMPYSASSLQVQDAGQTPFGHKVWRLTIASAYSSSHRHQVTLG